jgi:Zn-dependent protease
VPEAPRVVCVGCGTELAPALLSCPACHRLVHAERLKLLAAQADQATERGDTQTALVAWRAAHELLPAGTGQSQAVSARIAELSRRAESTTTAVAQPPTSGSQSGRKLGIVGVLGGLLWKLKFALVFAFTKLKLLLFGLTKMSTLLSMLLSWGVYWSLWGWKFALGFIAAMYIHEMGHVAALRQLGIRATAPMFVPGLGAFVRMDQYPQTPREEARVGLAGPIWGLGASIAALLLHVALGSPLFGAIARSSAWLNLFNLLPLGPLDGSRGFQALSRSGRWLVVGAFGIAWFFSHESLLVLLALAGGFRAFSSQAPAENDTRTLVEWLVLIAALAAIAALHV